VSTLTESPADTTATRLADRDTAMKFYATGRTPERLRAHAADPLVLEGIAVLSGITPGEAREQMLALAEAIDHITAEGITQEQAYFLMRLDKHFGPYPGARSTASAPDGKFTADITRFARDRGTARRA
jgi:hypothetical protein